MLGIKINDSFLTLAPGANMQLERDSPFFNANDLAAEYSLPITVPYTPGNARLLKMSFHYYTRRQKIKIPAELYDGYNFCYAGELVLDGAELDVNVIGQSQVSAYFFTGVSSFFQSVKNKKLKELKLGGVRSFAWTDGNPEGQNKGFWQHVHDTWKGNYDYVFAPIRNENWAGDSEEGSPEWMNKLGNNGYMDIVNNYTSLAPQVRLKYVLEQIFSEHGWALDYTQMDDAQWQIMFMPSFYAVKWQNVIATGTTPLPNIEINLQYHVPPEMLITDFIMALRNRYNWGFDFDSVKKVCSLFPLKSLANGRKKDWTKYLNRKSSSDFSEDTKVYAFSNDIDSNDSLPQEQDISKVKLGEPVESFNNLPAAAEGNVDQVVYVWRENRYYQSVWDEDGSDYYWVPYADNIFNYEPENNNVSISTIASTMPVYRTIYRRISDTDYYGYFPACAQEGNWLGKISESTSWGLRVLFYFGMAYEAKADGSAGVIRYPYLTSIPFTITRTETQLSWSNVYRHIIVNDDDDADIGIVQYWWSDSLRYIRETDILTCTLYLPRQELIDFKWSDVIILRGIRYVAYSLPDLIPFTGVTEAKLLRIG